MRSVPALLSLLLLASACSPSVSDPGLQAPAGQQIARIHPESGLPVIPLQVTSAGKVHGFSVEVAASAYEQAKGLMFRSHMGADEGMLFPFDPPQRASFWMKNTVIPLDIIFIGANGRILNIEANAVPYSETPRDADGLAAAVLELNGGQAAQLGIAPGDKVVWRAAKPLAPARPGG